MKIENSQVFGSPLTGGTPVLDPQSFPRSSSFEMLAMG